MFGCTRLKCFINTRRGVLDDAEHAGNYSLPSDDLRHKLKHEADHGGTPIECLRNDGETRRDALALVGTGGVDDGAPGRGTAGGLDRREGGVDGASGDGGGRTRTPADANAIAEDYWGFEGCSR